MLVYGTITRSQLMVPMPVMKILTRFFVGVVSADPVAFCWSAALPAARHSNKMENSFWRLLSEMCSGQIQIQIQIQTHSPSHWTGKQNSYCLVCLHWKSICLDRDAGMLTQYLSSQTYWSDHRRSREGSEWRLKITSVCESELGLSY